MTTAGSTSMPLAWSPLRAVRQRMRRWFEARLPLQDGITLTQRTVYILPTRPGLMLALTLLVLLVASINYRLNLGYLLTFLLAGCAVVGMHVCHGTLRGLALHLAAPEPAFVGASVQFGVHLHNAAKRTRYGIGVALMDTPHWSWTDVPAQSSTTVQLAFVATQRGMHRLPTLTAEARFPLGTFRVWTVWKPAAHVLVYPAPELHAPPLPQGEPRSGGTLQVPTQGDAEFDGVRAYRRGDPRKHVVWKKAAKTDTLVSRDAQQAQSTTLWLDLQHAQQSLRSHAAATQRELALSRLCAWVLHAERQHLRYGVRLGAQEIAPDTGIAHQQRCLHALALA